MHNRELRRVVRHAAIEALRPDAEIRFRFTSADGRHDLIAEPGRLSGGYIGGDEGQRDGLWDGDLRKPGALRKLLRSLLNLVCE